MVLVLPMRTAFPPMYIGMSRDFFFRSASAFFNAALSGEPGAYDLTGSFDGAG
jgi:hypothetical protein